jgi:hypothetical protein
VLLLPAVFTHRYIEIARGALATPAVNKQYAELLPNATGVNPQPASHNWHSMLK